MDNVKSKIIIIELVFVFLFIFDILNVDAQNYFPLSVGNIWIYSPSFGDKGNRVDSIIGEEILNGIHTYIWNRQEAPDDNYEEKRWIAKNNYDVLFYQIWGNEGTIDPAILLNSPGVINKLKSVVGDTWIQEFDFGSTHVKSTHYIESIDETITVPAGTFTNCVRIRELNETTQNSTTEYEYEKHWFAPNIGPIIYRDYTNNWQSVRFSQELISFSITIRGLPGDVNGDGKTELTDAIIGLKGLSGAEISSDIRPNYASSGADVNGDSRVGMEEVVYVMQFVGGVKYQTPTDPPINVAGTWTWIEEQIDVVRGSCHDLGERETYAITISQNGDQLTFAPDSINSSIAGSISGNSISLTGNIQLGDGSTIHDTINLIVSTDGKQLNGTLSQDSDSLNYCTGTFQISAAKSN